MCHAGTCMCVHKIKKTGTLPKKCPIARGLHRKHLRQHSSVNNVSLSAWIAGYSPWEQPLLSFLFSLSFFLFSAVIRFCSLNPILSWIYLSGVHTVIAYSFCHAKIHNLFRVCKCVFLTDVFSVKMILAVHHPNLSLTKFFSFSSLFFFMQIKRSHLDSVIPVSPHVCVFL